MNLTIPLTLAESKGLAVQLARYNAGNSDAPLTADEYVTAMLASSRYEWSQLVNSIPSASFVLRFSADEIAAIMAAARATDADGALLYPALKTYLDRLASEPTVNLTNPDLIAGVAMLVQAGLLTQQRADEVLSP